MASGEMSRDEFRKFLGDALGACVAASRAGAVHFVCMDWRHMDDLSAIGRDVYGDLLNLCIWNKSNAGMGSLYRSKHELIFVYRVARPPHFNAVELGKHGRNRTNVWDYASVNTVAGSRREDLKLHPTVKPTALVADAIQDVTRRGDLVLDVFSGSGTTLVASERTGRRFRGVEIDPAYVDVAIDRWEAMTGREGRAPQEGRGMSKVGPGHPPKSTRFRKGVSGNPRGRPREGAPRGLDFRFRCGRRQEIDDRPERQVPRGHDRGGALAQDISKRDRRQSLGPARSSEDDQEAGCPSRRPQGQKTGAAE